jgi:hypothetical protein
MTGLLALPFALLPRVSVALDAETRALEQAALCQAMPYRAECREAAPGTTTPAAPTPAPVPTPAAKRSAQPVIPPQAPLTQAEQVCHSYGRWILAMANTRDEGYSYVEALSLLRQRQDYRSVSPQAQARAERDLRAIYTYSWVSGSELRNLMERVCIEHASPTTGTSATAPKY